MSTMYGIINLLGLATQDLDSTINLERFAVLNICGFSLNKFSMRILSQYLGQYII